MDTTAPTLSLNDRIAAGIADVLGSMRTFWLAMAWLGGWIVAMTLLRGPDQFPFAFALFCTNVIQFVAVFVLQSTQNRQSAHLLRIVDHLDADEDREAALLQKVLELLETREVVA